MEAPRDAWKPFALVAGILLALALLLGFALGAAAQPTPCPLTWLAAHAGARETSGYNRGPLVDPIVQTGGGIPSQAPEWCGFTQAAAQRACGLPIPLGGMQGAARAWFLPGPRLVYYRGRSGSIDKIAVGLKAGYDYGAGIHHINAVAELGRPVRAGRAPRSYWAWGGNEGTGKEAGVHYNQWPISACDALSDWSH